MAIEADPGTARTIIEEAGLYLVSGSLQIICDGNAVKYEIPIFVINDPILYQEDSCKEITDQENSDLFSIRLRTVGSDDVQIKVTRKNTCSFLKDAIIKLKNCNREDLQLFYNGKSLNENFTLHHYKIENDSTIVYSIKPKIQSQLINCGIINSMEILNLVKVAKLYALNKEEDWEEVAKGQFSIKQDKLQQDQKILEFSTENFPDLSDENRELFQGTSENGAFLLAQCQITKQCNFSLQRGFKNKQVKQQLGLMLKLNGIQPYPH